MTKVLAVISVVLLLCGNTLFAAQKKINSKNGTSGFAASAKNYAKITAKGASPSERAAVIEKMMKKYKSKKYRKQLAPFIVEKDYLNSWMFYLKQRSAGAKENERLSIIERILLKYKNSGANTAEAGREYNILLELKRKSELTPPPTHQALLEPPTVQTRVEVSTAPASPPTPPAKPPKHFGAAVYTVGFYGLTGFEGIVNLGRNFSASFGQGSGSVDALFLESGLSLSRSSQIFLIRYGRQIYLETGMCSVNSEWTAVNGTGRKAANISNSAIPLAVGFETGNKRGFFFGAHFAYMDYQGGGAVKLTATDASTGRIKEFLVEPPRNGYTFCAGLGCYIF